MHKRPRGFTIVELLIVIVVIAVLAAVTVVAFNGINARANSSALQADLRGIYAKIALTQADNGTAPLASDAALTAVGFDVDTTQYGQGFYNGAGYYNLLYCRSTDNTSFALVGWSKTNVGFVAKGGSVTSYAGAPATSATVCPAVGINPYTVFWIYAAGAWQVP